MLLLSALITTDQLPRHSRAPLLCICMYVCLLRVCARLLDVYDALHLSSPLRDTLAPVRVTSHGAAILLSGAPFTHNGTLLLGLTPAADIRPFQRSTSAGILDGRIGITAPSKAGDQLVQAVDRHVRTIDGRGSRQERLRDSQRDLGGTERSETGSRAALLPVETRMSISETLSFGAAEAISRVDGVEGGPAGRQLNWNSR